MRTAAGIFLFLLSALLAQGAPLEAPAGRVPVARPKPLLLLSLYNGDKLMVRALSATVQGSVLEARLDDGRPAAWNNTVVVKNLPWYTDAELADSTLDLGALITLYDNAAREHPEFGARLSDQTARVRAGLEARKKRAAAILADVYHPATPYAHEELSRRIQAGEDASVLVPDERAAIEKVLAPFREHLANLQAGKTLYAGVWRTPEEKRALDEEARLQALSARLAILLDVQIISASTVNEMLAVAGIVLAVPVLLGVILVFRRKRLLGALCILLPVAAGAYYASSLGSTNLPLSTQPEASGAEASSQTITRVLAAGRADRTPPVSSEPQTVHISEAEVNAFLARHVQIQGTPVPGAVNLRSLTVRLTKEGASVLEAAEWRGQSLVVRQNFQFQTIDGRTVISGAGVSIGEAPLPGAAQRALRDSLVPPLARFLTEHDPSAAYTVASLNPGGVELASTAPTPAPVAQATPPPTPTPAETPTETPMAPLGPPSSAPEMAQATAAPEQEEVELPPLSAAGTEPGPDNSFYVYAIWDQINTSSEAEISSQMDRLRDQLGTGNRFHHVGFAFILGGNEARLRSICSLARQKGLAIGVILGAQTHSGKSNEVQQDFRAAQWRLAGAEWRGGDGARDHLVPTPSRYCTAVHEAYEKSQRQRGELLRRVMQSYPGVVTCIDSSIEEELAGGGQTSDDKLADYSPFAVTEFRDWLRHTGMYDADTGKYAGQGAPAQITGHYVLAKGKLRSPFYGAADPNTSAGGSSFNERFGTKFTTWALKYWDLEAFPGKITDDGFNPTPEAGGRGYTEGGFDAPRKRDASPWWTAWSWDYQDREKRYPLGNPDAPAFGFRQVEVHNFVVDMLRVAVNAHLPPNLMFAHQIPGETATAERDRSGATPTWTGFVPFNGTVGITRFGPFDPKLALQYTKTVPQSRGWGIFEWHPKPNADPKSPELYEKASADLQTYYRAKCHHLFAGWWSAGESKQSTTFPLADSEFAHAIKDFMASRPDQPYPGTPP